MCLLPAALAAQQQTVTEEVQRVIVKQQPPHFFEGISVAAEMTGLYNRLMKKDTYSMEWSIQANLLNRFFPIAEIGIGQANSLNTNNQNHYATKAPFFRVGMDYNVMHKKPKLPGYLLIGFRFATSNFKFDVEAPNLTDPHYQHHIFIPFSYTGLESRTYWAELVAGVRTTLFKGLQMGWTLKYKARISQSTPENAKPWYVPGYGSNSSTGLTFNYHVVYYIPFHKK